MDESKLWRQSAAISAVAYSIGAADAATAAVAASVTAASTRYYYILI